MNTYVIDGCGAYYECKVLQVMDFSGQEISPFVKKHTEKSPITTIFTLRKSSKSIKT